MTTQEYMQKQQELYDQIPKGIHQFCVIVDKKNNKYQSYISGTGEYITKGFMEAIGEDEDFQVLMEHAIDKRAENLKLKKQNNDISQ